MVKDCCMHSEVWLALLSFSIWLPLPVMLIITFPKAEEDPSGSSFSLLGSVEFVAGTLVSARPWPRLPQLLRGQLVSGGIIVTGAIVFWHWEAMIISYLAARTISMPFSSLDGLIRNTDFKV